MTRSHFIEILMILTTYVFDLGVRLTEFSVTVESVTLRFYCRCLIQYIFFVCLYCFVLFCFISLCLFVRASYRILGGGEGENFFLPLRVFLGLIHTYA